MEGPLAPSSTLQTFRQLQLLVSLHPDQNLCLFSKLISRLAKKGQKACALVYVAAMNIGLAPQQRTVVHLARCKGLCTPRRWIVVIPWWFCAVLVLLLTIPSYGLSLLLLPLTFWQRQRAKAELEDWALTLRRL